MERKPVTTLVTGAAGFIGSHVAEQLLLRGERVVGLDNFDAYYDPRIKRANRARLERLPGLAFVEGDVRDAAAMVELVDSQAVTRVVHLAALAGVRASVEQARDYTAVNVAGSVNLLEAARRGGVEIFLLGSTSSVYGRTPRLPFREDDPADRPLAPYPATKRAAELLAHSYTHQFGLPVTALRFFNVYGPAGRPDMMPLRIMRAIGEGEPLPIFDGGALERDWTYIDDVVAGVLAALERPLGYQVINLGFGKPIALGAFVDEIERLAGRPLRRVEASAPPTEPPITYCDNAKARRLLGFDPRVGVQEGLARTWAWFQSELGR